MRAMKELIGACVLLLALAASGFASIPRTEVSEIFARRLSGQATAALREADSNCAHLRFQIFGFQPSAFSCRFLPTSTPTTRAAHCC
jgi:hypothetical protein